MQRVLIIDDMPSMSMAVSMLMRKYNREFKFFFAENGEQAISILEDRGNEISLIISDMMMPGLDGLGVANYLKEKHPAKPLIIMTAMSSEKVTAEIDEFKKENPNCALLKKPIQYNDLTSTLASLNF